MPLKPQITLIRRGAVNLNARCGVGCVAKEIQKVTIGVMGTVIATDHADAGRADSAECRSDLTGHQQECSNG
jgi:hypothetical protein